MFARLWWKEARQTWPAWAFLAFVGLALQTLLRLLVTPTPEEGLLGVATLTAVIYLFLIAAAAFAGERENGTLGLLDALPVDRLRLWSAKASFALVTTLALAALLWATTVLHVGVFPKLGPVTVAMLLWGAVALGWGLLWSTVLGNAMHAAVLAMASVGATLAALVNLQEGPTTQAAPALLGIALATAAASALAFVRTGPPRWERRQSGPLPTEDEDDPAPALPRRRRPSWVWPSSVGRLVWETWRRVRADLKMLIAVAVGAVVYFRLTEWDRTGTGLQLLVLAMGFLGLLTGSATFNTENRGGTHRFLDQHGARPGVVWTVKVLTWWAATVVLWAFLMIPIVRKLQAGGTPVGTPRVADIPMSWTDLATYLGVLAIPFAVGALSGMVFRRGIMAGAVALVGVIALELCLGLSTAAGIMAPTGPLYVALALLFVTWVWSGDWLRFPPGLGKWARLAGWCVGVGALMVFGYVANRAWNVPTLPERQARELFEPDRFGWPSPPDQDAAPLYREAERLALGVANAVGGRHGLPAEFYEPFNTPATDAKVAAWLEKVEPVLAVLRKASRLPNCDFEDVRKATIHAMPSVPSDLVLTAPLTASAKSRLARGDVEGSWDDVETLLRMARQFSMTRGVTYLWMEGRAIGLAFRWAEDARQTAESLERALAAFRALPPGYSPADRARVDRIVFQHTADLPWEDRIDEYLRQYGPNRKVGTWDALGARVVTSPWETARARKVYDLATAAWIQMLEERSYSELAQMQVDWRGQWISSRLLTIKPPDGPTRYLGPAEMAALSWSSPMARLASPGMDFRQIPRVELGRRALATVLRLRLHQARHDGALPESLTDLLPSDEDLHEGAFDSELMDPYGHELFGYVRSRGQLLFPLAEVMDHWFASPSDKDRLKPANDCWLLYSVGPDGRDDRAEHALDYTSSGDVVYPLKDGVKPPAADAP